jgi:amino acid permease
VLANQGHALRQCAKEQKMKMIIIGGVLTAALLFAVVSSIRADGPHWVAGGLLADGPSVGAPARANGA